MIGLTYTLLGDGSSDRLLDYPIRWALTSLGIPVEQGQWADLRRSAPPPNTLTERAQRALELYPARLLFVHRDAEGADLAVRIGEVRDAVQGVVESHVAVVPVRMTEAWLLHDESAIRRASGNPNGRAQLTLPSPDQVESLPDPKAALRTALLEASELRGRRLRKKEAEFPQMRARTAELIGDYTPLCGLPAFRTFLASLEVALSRIDHDA